MDTIVFVDGQNLYHLAMKAWLSGVPDESSSPFWHGFWTNKIRYLRNGGIYVCQGNINSGGQEKGVDVSLALDLVQAAHERRYDVATGRV